MTPYDIVKKACIEANPDILKLEFGCVLKRHVSDEDFMLYTVLENGSVFRPDKIWVSSRVFGDMLIQAESVFSHTHSEELSKEEIKDKYEILGREIRLADVLYMVSQKTPHIIGLSGQKKTVVRKHNETDAVFLNRAAHERIVDKGWVPESTMGQAVAKIVIDWNLKHDSLSWHRDNQPETVEFLAKLLGKDE